MNTSCQAFRNSSQIFTDKILTASFKTENFLLINTSMSFLALDIHTPIQSFGEHVQTREPDTRIQLETPAVLWLRALLPQTQSISLSVFLLWQIDN